VSGAASSSSAAGRNTRSNARKSVLEKGKKANGATTMRRMPPIQRRVQGGSGQVATSSATKIAAKISSDAIMLNMYEPT
jgi:hypothetical protein